MEKIFEGEFFKAMADQAPELVFVYQIEGHSVKYINSAFEETLRRKFSDFEANPDSLFDIVHIDDREYVELSLKQFMKRKSRSLLDFRIIWPGENERWMRLKLYPVLEDNEITFVTGVLEDDSPRKKSILNVQKINIWKNSILEILAHDLQGPIGVVQMLTSSIKSQLPEADHKRIHEWASSIEEICQRNIDLIRSLLRRESLDTSEVEMSLERVDVVWEIRQAINLFLQANDLLETQLSFDSTHENVFVEIDVMKFMQIIHNLLSNSLKFTPTGGYIKVLVEKLESTLLVSVEDNGIGIPRRFQPYLFHKYSEAQRPGLKGEESTGLGMWIIKTLTELHKGRVWFETEENKGTTFFVEIPLSLPDKV